VPIKIGENLVVVGVTKRKDADLAEFAKQRDQLTETMLKTRQDQVYDDYIAAAIARMKNEGKITIFKEALAAIAEDEPATPQPPRRSRMPLPTR